MRKFTSFPQERIQPDFSWSAKISTSIAFGEYQYTANFTPGFKYVFEAKFLALLYVHNFICRYIFQATSKILKRPHTSDKQHTKIWYRVIEAGFMRIIFLQISPNFYDNVTGCEVWRSTISACNFSVRYTQVVCIAVVYPGPCWVSPHHSAVYLLSFLGISVACCLLWHKWNIFSRFPA